MQDENEMGPELSAGALRAVIKPCSNESIIHTHSFNHNREENGLVLKLILVIGCFMLLTLKSVYNIKIEMLSILKLYISL